MKSVLLVSRVPDCCETMLGHHFRLYRSCDMDDRDSFLKMNGKDIVAVVGSRVSAGLIAMLPDLRVIACFGAGYDNIDLDAARAAGVQVSNTPGRLSAAVAELALGLMIALARNIPAGHQYVKEGRWNREGNLPLTGQLSGSSVGIVGHGRIGGEIARRCVAFDMTVSYYGRSRQPSLPYRYFDKLTDIARNVDWLVLAIPGGKDTRGLIDRRVLEALGPEGYLVNMARGSMIDQDALIEMLASGKLAGAALDVFDGEPHVPATLRKLENLVLSPHNGSATHTARKQMSQQVVENLLAYFEKGAVIDRIA